MFNNFKYFRKMAEKADLSHINKNYLIRFAEREIEEWQKFIEMVNKRYDDRRKRL